MVNEKGWEIGLSVSLGPHDLRHTRITHFAEQGVSLYDLMEFGGWNSLDMARRYIKSKKVANEGLAKLIDEFYEN